MKTTYLVGCLLALFSVGSCETKKNADASSSHLVQQQIQKLSAIRTEAEKNDDLQTFLSYYDPKAISMPEYQPTLQGFQQIEAFYKEIFQRQHIKTFQRTADEIIALDRTIIEIGTFKKEYTDTKSDSLIIQKGKYWSIWQAQADGNFKLKGETYGFFHPVQHPEALVIQLPEKKPVKSEASLDQKIPFELKAYNALMEKGVRERDGVLRSEFFTEDGKFMPFQEATIAGMHKIKPYLIAYSNRGEVTIDSISVYTYHYESFGDYILEYPEFRVKWSTSQFSGSTEGKGIRIWKRQADQSLKIYREIGTHNLLR